ncbi:hypothetical protein [Shinella sp. HZN7]|uniref:hypothetical protein n=1 Tax=Shinella sp. (strain HZN7) TaxID=879274 RepID=UPI0011AB6DDE|nr:hypothetical protein [Shinella sp. HZN7]
MEVYKSDNGNLEEALDRAKAHDLHAALAKSPANPNAKVLDWFDCLRIMENADIVMLHLSEFTTLRDAAKSKGRL